MNQTNYTPQQQPAAVQTAAGKPGPRGMAIADNRPATIQRRANNTGLPDKLKTGIENLSGMAMDHVQVHYNSAQPAQLNAHAYAQGSQIHVAPGQEKHLPHEAWHVVQQAQGRVQPTMQMKGGVQVNDSKALEKEADTMGAKALQAAGTIPAAPIQKKQLPGAAGSTQTVQRMQTIEVNEPSEQLLQDPGKAVATKQQWNSKFVIYVYNAKGETPAVQVIIHIITGANDKVFDTWSKSITAAWSYKFSIAKEDGTSYPITVQIVRGSAAYSDHTVENVKADKAAAGRGLFGTDHMLRWGEADPQDIPHEVGHMLGNKDEYGTVNGHNYDSEYNILDSDTYSIMRRGDQPPRMRHFELIFTKVRDSGALGAAPQLVKYTPRKAAPVIASGIAAAAKPGSSAAKKTAARPAAEHALVIGQPHAGPSGAQAAAARELGAALHKKRVEHITAHLLKDEVTASLTEEQVQILTSRDWNNDPDASAAVKKVLGL